MKNAKDTELEGASYALASKGRNDPDYDKTLEEYARNAKVLQRNVTSVQVIGGYDPHIKVRADRKRIRETAAAIADLADAPLADASTKAPNGYRQPPRHTYYREDRRVTEDDLERRSRLRKARGWE